MHYPDPQDKYVDINGLRMHYLDWGNPDKQPMLLLHGFSAHAHLWDSFAPSFSSRYHVLALDQRGHGESESPELAAYSLDDHFSDLVCLVEILNLNRLIFIGHSMGGRNALFYTACAPEKVDRLVLVDARPGNDQQGPKALENFLTHLPLQARSIDHIVREIRSIYPYLSRNVGRYIVSHGYHKLNNGQFVPKYDVRMSLDAEQAGYLVEDLWGFLENILCPTLVVRGKESPFISAQEAQKMCLRLSTAELKEIPGATHLPMLENPETFHKVISSFLDP
ncbi:MAG: alpha/beta hydrolase [Desulfatiglans sp.]|jgi:pimeloyl-ACP methyl ester carboxylesterase|nr:alpha/beta hydrolase [Desulfatiglans sp.]